jgi:pimeloyl-ACP methyl ester carboxylesterase
MFQIDMNSLLKIISVTICLLITSVSLAENRLEIGQINGMHGCIVKYERYHPEKPYTEAVILLAHGFKRKLSSMRGWAKHWSEMGIPVVIPSLCRSSWFKGRHSQNADDLRALREQLKIDEVIYAGFSAGGLAAYLAALEDPATLAYLGLDPVDSAKLGLADEAIRTPPMTDNRKSVNGSAYGWFNYCTCLGQIDTL